MTTVYDYFSSIGRAMTASEYYGWDCYGPTARVVDHWRQGDNELTACCVFDSVTSVVYELDLCMVAERTALRWINPEYENTYLAEAENRQISDVAWDDVEFQRVSSADTMLSLIRKVVDDPSVTLSDAASALDNPVDTSEIRLELTEDEMFKLMKMAHEHDVSLNLFVSLILQKYVDEYQENNNG